MNIEKNKNKELIEESKNEINRIRQKIADLKEMEDIYLLVKFSQDAKYMLYGSSTEEIKICVYFYEKNILQKFITRYMYKDVDGNKHPVEEKLYTQLRCSNGDFRTDDYVKEYAQVASILEKKMGNGDCIILRKDTKPEDFLKQLDNEYAIKYSHYELSKDLTINNEKRNPKIKI